MASVHAPQHPGTTVATVFAAALLATLAAGGVWLAASHGHAPMPLGDQGDRSAVAALIRVVA